ncbi:maltase-intestinal-like [Stylonychia lemnae]|uniref:Maltase-intestinal-like n=1 Tax=Stylonychia lemnae TaxID=5949 RepID=A0A078BBN5_STYLE|nr:maltase-intestinal-like [Stylonychia lemnae]|eukprot:CDW91804.1 maltase-intestinal-like [Stylonychia lemnae]
MSSGKRKKSLFVLDDEPVPINDTPIFNSQDPLLTKNNKLYSLENNEQAKTAANNDNIINNTNSQSVVGSIYSKALQNRLSKIQITAIILGIVFKKSDKKQEPFIYNPISNPYQLMQINENSFGIRSYRLRANTSTENFMDAINYSQSKAQLNQDLLNRNNLKKYKMGLNWNQFGFQYIQTNSTQKLIGQTPNSSIQSQYWRIFDKDTNYEMISTQAQQLALMSQFSVQGLKIQGLKLFGLGESNNPDFFLKSGNHTIYPMSQDYSRGKGAHPFLMAQLNNNKFIGIYVFNSNPLQFEIFYNYTENYSVVNIMSMGCGIELLFFVGSTFQRVVQNFHYFIGTPKIIPYWSQGLIMRSSLFKDSQFVIDTLNNLTSNGFPLETISFQENALIYMKNLEFNDLLLNISRYFPQMQFLLPFSYFISESDQVAKDQSLDQCVQINEDEILKISLNGEEGYCLDPFNQNSTMKYLSELLQNQELSSRGYWLSNNLPKADKIVNKFEKDSADESFQFNPDGVDLEQDTIPMRSYHKDDEGNKIYHHQVHSTFGSYFAKVFQQSFDFQSSQRQPFIISDSTFPGLGQYGISHIFNLAPQTMDDLQILLSNMISFSVYGLPISTSLLCQNDLSDTARISQELCARQFQYSVLSPLTIIQNINAESSITSFDNTFQESIKESITQRYRYLNYQRTELYKIQKYGGSLIQPLFTVYSDDIKIQNQSMLNFLQFGQNIISFLPLSNQTDQTEVYYPGSKLINLETMDILKTYIGQSLRFNISNNFGKIGMFQIGISTVIAFQNTSKYQVQQANNLKDIPIILSVALDGYFGYALGQVYIEQGSQESHLTEFYEIKVSDSIISFKQQNNGSCQNVQSTNIEKIYLTFLDKTVSAACAILGDLQTVQSLYITEQNISRGQVVIQPNNPNDANDKSTIQINNLAFIMYGDSSLKCDQSMFQLQLDEILIDQDYTFQAKVIQKISALYKGWSPAQYFNITLLSDNSLYIMMNSQQNQLKDPLAKIYDRSFADFKNIGKSFTLKDILTYGQDPFYIQINHPIKKDKILFSTKDSLSFYHIDFNLVNYQQPSSDQNVFYGIGERNGQFFLQDKYTYALFNNDNNIPNNYQSNGRVYEYGKNGHLPIIYSQLTQSTITTAVIIYTSQGSEISYFKQNGLPRISLLQSNTQTEFALVFDDISSIQQQVFKHIKLGSLFQKSKQIQNSVLPPLESFFGVFHMFKNQDNITSFTQNLVNDTQLPIEGFVLNMDSLDGYKSMTFNQTKYTNLQQDLAYLSQNNMKIFQISKSGFSTTVNDSYFNYILEQNLSIRAPFPDYSDNKPQYGYDQQGQVIYVDYSLDQSSQLLSNMINDFSLKYNLQNQYGVQLKNNEISDVFCKDGMCYKEDYDGRNIYWIAKPGNIEMTMNTFGYAFRDIGREDQFHNLNGLMEQIQYSNLNLQQNQPPLLSDSIALGSGLLGFVGKIANYHNFDLSDAALTTQSLQQLNILGMPLFSYSFDLEDVDLQSQNFNRTFYSYLIQSTFSTITVQNLYPFIQDSDKIKDIQFFNKIKYMLLRYTRTQVYVQLNTGKPVIKPLFHDYPNDQQAYDLVNKQYMFGESIIVQIDQSIRPQSQIYFPQGYWCSIYYFENQTSCLYFSKGTYYQPKQNDPYRIYLKQGTVSPFQDVFGSYQQGQILNSKYLQQLTIDLHIMPNFDLNGKASAIGQILIHGYDSKYNGFCFIEMKLINDILAFTDTSPDIKISNNIKCNYQGFYLGKIFIYFDSKISYKSAKINNLLDMEVMPSGQDISQLQSPNSFLHLSDINNITFRQ